jgi:peptidoglycan/xylan/chitin deacetylase (PgdA/CDA1 family)
VWVASKDACHYTPTAGLAGVPLPILMYHNVQPDGARRGDYIVSASQLEGDLRYLQETGRSTVVIADLIAYVREGTPLPERPVMLTFDDGQLSNTAYAVPLLEKYGMRAVFSVVGSYIERAEAEQDPNPAYAYMTWADIRFLAESGVAEIQNHSYNLHQDSPRRGVTRMRGEALASYRQTLEADLGKMQFLLQTQAGVSAACFTYPYGFSCDESEDVLRALGFSAAMNCVERTNYLTRDPEALFHLHRFNRGGQYSTRDFMRSVNLE